MVYFSQYLLLFVADALSKANKTTNNNKNEGKEQASDITTAADGDDSTATADEATKKEGESVFYFYQVS